MSCCSRRREVLVLAVLLHVTVVSSHQNKLAHARHKARKSLVPMHAHKSTTEKSLVSMHAHSDLVLEDPPQTEIAPSPQHLDELANGILSMRGKSSSLLGSASKRSESIEGEIRHLAKARKTAVPMHAHKSTTEKTFVSMNANSDLVLEGPPRTEIALSAEHLDKPAVNGSPIKPGKSSLLLDRASKKSESTEHEIRTNGDVSVLEHTTLSSSARKTHAKVNRNASSLAKLRARAWANVNGKGRRTNRTLVVQSASSKGTVGKPAKGDDNSEEEGEEKKSGGALKVGMYVLLTVLVLFVLTVVGVMFSRQYRINQPFGGRYALSSE